MVLNTVGQLGKRIAFLANKLENGVENNGAPPPSLESDNVVANPDHTSHQTAMELAGLCRELEKLALGPRQTLGMMALSVHDASALSVIAIFEIPSLVPLQGSITFAELSGKCGLDEDRLTRILRYAMTNSIFREQPAGYIQHTTLSTHLAEDSYFCDFLRTIGMVFNPANPYLLIAMVKYPKTESMLEAAHGLARHTDKSFYDWLDENPELRENFDIGMEGISRGGQRMQDTDLRAFPWHNLPQRSLVVDMGGSGGHFARDLAQKFPSFSIIVQDLPQVIQTVLKQLKVHDDSVSYQEHDIFQDQPIKYADVYFMRHVFHNHPDTECVKILVSLLPALKAGARVLVSEYVVPPASELTSDLTTKAMRQMDLMTMALFNAKERTKDEYAALFRQASPKLQFQGMHQVVDDPGSCIFEAVYQD